MLILTVGSVCYITITGGSSQHVVLFDLYVAASERSPLDAVKISTFQMANPIILIVVGIVCNTHSNLCNTCYCR